MVYKKYIEKDGKVYGPYIYHSRRVDGKVISEYQGAEKPNHKKFIFLLFGILLLAVFLTVFFFNFKGKITGNIVQNSLMDQTGNEIDATIVYPKIYFTLLSRQIAGNTEEKNETIPLPIEQNTIETGQSNESPILQNQSGGDSTITEETVTEEPQQNSNVETEATTLDTVPEDTPTSVPQDIQPSTPEQSTEQPTTPESISSEQEIADTPEQQTDTTDSDVNNEEQNSAPITGGVISGILNTISNFFLSLGLTGKAVSEPTIIEVKGELSANEPFSYNLEDGEGIGLLSGSVKTDSKSLSDNVIQINYQGNAVLISTNYSEFVKTNLTITPPINQLKAENFNIKSLSEEEKKFLIENFDNPSIQTIKSEFDKAHNRYLIKYKLGDYYIEYSYDSSLDEGALELQMESDRVKWIRDIINKLSENESVNQEANQFISNYSL